MLLSDREQTFLQRLRYVCYLLFLVKIALTPYYDRRFLALGLAALACAALSVLQSDHRQLLLMAIAVIAAYGVDARRVLRCAGAVFAAGLGATLLLCAAGILQNIVMDAERNRQNLGFNWVTLAPIYFLFINIAWVNWRGARMRIWEFLLLELACLLLYRATNTRLTMVLNTVFLAVSAVELRILHGRWRLLRGMGKWLCLAPLALAVIVFAVQLLYTPSDFWAGADALFSKRISLVDQALRGVPIKLFGQPITWIGYSLRADYIAPPTGAAYNNVDGSFVRILLEDGAVPLLFLLLLYGWGLYKAAAADDPVLSWSYVVVLLFCVTEQWLFELSFNYFPLLAAASLSAQPAPADRRIRFHAPAEGACS